MTQEEKARAYDEALEKGRIFRDHLLETGDKGIAGEIEYIFPALSQSEDEQIRKALIEMVHDTTGDELWVDYNVHKEDALAWLEKQCYTKKDIDDAYLKGICDAKHELGKQGEQKLFDYESANILQKDFAQKQEPKKIEDEIEIPFDAKDSELQEETYYIPKGFHAEIDDDKVIIKKGEKSAAWSDEDEHRVEDTIYFLDTAKKHYACTIELDACIDWLKSLKNRIGG